jgi:hypothetical protein
MNRCILSAGLLIFVSVIAPSYAADPEFKVALVVESREYERQKASSSIGGVSLPAATQWTSRVTVALDGMRITGEWAPKTTISASAEDFPRGTDVEAATTRNQLLLKHRDGSVITARIVQRVKQPAAAEGTERD